MSNSKLQQSPTRSKSKRAALTICLLLLMLPCMGCVIGTKTERQTVFVSPVPIPEAAKGAVVIATDKPIELAIMDSKDFFFKRSVGGYVLVDPWFYRHLLSHYSPELVNDSKGK